MVAQGRGGGQSVGPSHWFLCFSRLNSRSLSSFPPEWFPPRPKERNQPLSNFTIFVLILPRQETQVGASQLCEVVSRRGGRVSVYICLLDAESNYRVVFGRHTGDNCFFGRDCQQSEVLEEDGALPLRFGPKFALRYFGRC